jgi:signal transduction histidine kinase
MPDQAPPSRLRRLAEQGVVPVALVLLPVLVAVLVFNARAAERSHRATAEDALRDYASFAAWQFSRQARQLLSSHLTMSTAPVRDIAASLGDSLPPAEVITEHAARCGCGFQEQIRFAFRIDLADADAPSDGGAVQTNVPSTAGVRAALHARLTPRGLRPLDRDARHDPSGNKLRDASRLRVDTLGGTAYLLAYAVVGDNAGRPRAIYGLAADPAHLDHDFDRDIIRKQPLLPPSLVGRADNDSVLTVRTVSPQGVLAFESGQPVDAHTFSASDTLEPMLGSLVTTVSIRPEIASSLVIGGLPRSRLPLSLALLGAASVVSIVALVQFRRARELTRLRSQFVANVSHELRTPLTQISMFSETLMLERERSPDERRHFLSVIFREARRLTNLVDGVLRFSRGEAGASRLRLETRDVAADIRDAAQAFLPLAEAAETTLDLEIDDALEVSADSAAVRQVLLNLLDNAVKYGPPGQTVTVRATRGADEVQISVEDEGLGIPPEERQRVFDPFTRLDPAGAPKVSGSGIGLAVVRDLVQAHGGRVWVDAGAGDRGTRVAFTLRAAATASSADESARGHAVRGADAVRF